MFKSLGSLPRKSHLSHVLGGMVRRGGRCLAGSHLQALLQDITSSREAAQTFYKINGFYY